MDLISKLMVYPPRERLRPLEALMHPFFNEIREEKFGIPNVKLPGFFDFTKGEFSFYVFFRGIDDTTRDCLQIIASMDPTKEELNFIYIN